MTAVYGVAKVLAGIRVEIYRLMFALYHNTNSEMEYKGGGGNG